MKTVTVHDPMFRRLSRNVLLRHGLMALLSAGLVLIFAAIHGEWSPMHRWNRALADASLVLVALSMGLGPLARLLRPAVLVLPYRRKWASTAAFWRLRMLQSSLLAGSNGT